MIANAQPVGWQNRRLGDPFVASIVMGQSPPSDTYNTEGIGLPFFQGKVDFGLRHPTTRVWCSKPLRIAEEGDILVSVRAPVGAVNVASERCSLGRGLAGVRAGVGALPEYLFYLLKAAGPRLNSLGSGAIFRAINKAALLSLPLTLPPHGEQRVIAALLSKVQAALELEQRRLAAISELSTATIAKIFRHGLRGERLKHTQLGEIPDSWSISRLGDIASIERGRFTHRPRNDPRFYGGTTPFIQTGDIVKARGRVRSYSQTLNDAGLAVSRVFPRGTIVLTIAANIGDTAILEFDSAFPDSIVGLTPNAGLDAEYLELYLRTQKPEMDRLAPKGTQKNINIQFLRPWPIALPSLSEQREIVGILTTVDQRLEASETRRHLLGALFSSSLHQLMTGQLRVTPLLEQGQGKAHAHA